MALIECRKLTRSYAKGETTITPLAELDLDVEHGEFLARATDTDPMENMQNAGLTLRERHGEPAQGKARFKFYDDNDRAKLVVWCPDPHVVAEFPRTGNCGADAWRVRCIEACLEAVGGKE